MAWTPPPPQEVSAFPPGTPEWAQWNIVNTFTTDADRKTVTDIVARGLVGYPSLSRARMYYAAACHERQWAGWQARLAWACIEALVKPAEDDDIPF